MTQSQQIAALEARVRILSEIANELARTRGLGSLTCPVAKCGGTMWREGQKRTCIRCGEVEATK